MTTVVSPIPRLSLRVAEAAEALGVSEDFFSEHIARELHWVRRGRCRMVAVAEVERWLEHNGEVLETSE